ncbi:acyl-[ACP]--phospholipid O-acyltransferase [Thalassoroseus pseudoceratinae]|uniref:acyl-[ACP]--phospholipid O-acyltransferase n=1 Tax=Thalassoroseus pseudoceratinae TaxID=2713176 RepID=UPI001422DE53|nr:acyl-[ACP]--phospholipid O-acyltransferase [Thalassoroseus pseudoceratinae]
MSSPSQPEVQDGLSSKSFIALLVTQFLGAANDNAFRWLAVSIAIGVMGIAREGTALALGTVLFTAPYLLLANMAGFLADRFDKRAVIVWCKVAELVLASMLVGSILLGGVVGVNGSLAFMFVTVFLMGCQSALFGPSKFGSIPELVRTEKISAANGLMGMISVVAAALGTLVGLSLYQFNETAISHFVGHRLNIHAEITVLALWPVILTLLGMAVVGVGSSLMIRRLTPADPNRKMAKNPFRETANDLKVLFARPAILRVALGISFFWMMASLAQCNVNLYGEHVFGLSKSGVGILMVVLVGGVAIGSVLAGWLSHGRVELGIVPLGAVVIIIGTVGLCIVGWNADLPITFDTTAKLTTPFVMSYPSFWLCSAFLFLLGFGAGLFLVPLEAFLQEESETQVRGTVIAGTNFVAFTMVILSSGIFFIERDLLGLSSSTIFLLCGIVSVPVLLYALYLLPMATVRFLVWLLMATNYRVRIRGLENIPKRGGALIVANHVSYVDGWLVTLSSPRQIRLMADGDFYKGSRLITWMSDLFKVISINPTMGPKGLVKALKEANRAVANGELVCIFAEGKLTRTGQLDKFQRGLLRVVDGTDCPVIPLYIDKLWGSIFSYHGGKIIYKWPRQWPHRISMNFGKPVQEPKNLAEVRQSVLDMSAESAKQRPERKRGPVRRFVRRCKQAKFQTKISDSTGQSLTGGKLLAGALALKKQLREAGITSKHGDAQTIGVMLPPSVGGFLANTAISMSRDVCVNLNYTLSESDLNYCIEKSGLTHVITSKKVMDKLNIELNAESVFLEDLIASISKGTRIKAGIQAYALPPFVVERLHGLNKIQPDDLLTILFTSGSTGQPKGVMLSHYNVQANIDSIDDLFNLKARDTQVGVMPFFHAFGYTLGMWLTGTTPIRAVYHHNPIDGRTVGKLCEEHSATILMGTPTFLRAYIKRCKPEQMKHLDLAVVGAERLSPELAEEFQQKFGVLPTEGYGTTELAPLATANIPNTRTGFEEDDARKIGSIGRPIPGVSVKVVDPDTGEDRDFGEEGLLLVRGANVMQGYLDEPEKTAEVLNDGWYNTGDIATIDESGFVTLAGRLNRFSKIGGEMVPHGRIEEELLRIVGNQTESEGEVPLVVTAVPDEKRGERLVVLHRPLDRSPEDILQELSAGNLPNLWLPSRDSFLEVESIPVLGSGKLDLKGIRETAVQHFSAGTAASTST